MMCTFDSCSLHASRSAPPLAHLTQRHAPPARTCATACSRRQHRSASVAPVQALRGSRKELCRRLPQCRHVPLLKEPAPALQPHCRGLGAAGLSMHAARAPCGMCGAVQQGPCASALWKRAVRRCSVAAAVARGPLRRNVRVTRSSATRCSKARRPLRQAASHVQCPCRARGV